jgi:hypothetical protein
MTFILAGKLFAVDIAVHVPAVIARDLDEACAQVCLQACDATSMALPVALGPNSVLLVVCTRNTGSPLRVVHQLFGIDVKLVVVAHLHAVRVRIAQAAIERVE